MVDRYATRACLLRAVERWPAARGLRLRTHRLAVSSVASIRLSIDAPCVLARLGSRRPGHHGDTDQPSGRRIPSSMERYDPHAIEARWQAVWDAERIHEVPNPLPGEDTSRLMYVLEMLPYPPGDLPM